LIINIKKKLLLNASN